MKTPIFRISKTVGYELIPNSDPGINSLGWMDKERNIEKIDKTYRIIVLGDSLTADDGMMRYKYPFLLEKLLNKNSTGKTIEVWNCGVPATNTLIQSLYLKYKIMDYNPDMIIIGFCMNDFYSTPLLFKTEGLLLSYIPGKEKLLKFNFFIFRHSYLYRFIIARVILYKNKWLLNPRWNTEYNIVKNAFSNMQLLTSSKNIPLLVLIFPLFSDNYNIMRQPLLHNSILQILNDLKIPYIDLIHTYKKYGSLEQFRAYRNFRVGKNDYLHFNEKADEVAAKVIYTWLSKNHFFVKNKMDGVSRYSLSEN